LIGVEAEASVQLLTGENVARERSESAIDSLQLASRAFEGRLLVQYSMSSTASVELEWPLVESAGGIPFLTCDAARGYCQKSLAQFGLLR
jgi:hypothetical protein